MVNYFEIFFYISIFLLGILSYYFCFSKKYNSSSKKNAYKLPPGSMGWPYIGETLQLYSQDPNAFFINRQRRYHFKKKLFFTTYVRPCPLYNQPELTLISVLLFNVRLSGTNNINGCIFFFQVW